MTLNQRGGHIGIPVSNIEHSKAFYVSLGFEQLEAHQLTVEKGTNHIAFLTFGPVTIELYQLAGETTAKQTGAIHHFAVSVDSLEGIKEKLNRLNIPIVHGPEQLPFGENGVVYLMIEGPDKERVEFDYFL